MRARGPTAGAPMGVARRRLKRLDSLLRTQGSAQVTDSPGALAATAEAVSTLGSQCLPARWIYAISSARLRLVTVREPRPTSKLEFEIFCSTADSTSMIRA